MYCKLAAHLKAADWLYKLADCRLNFRHQLYKLAGEHLAALHLYKLVHRLQRKL